MSKLHLVLANCHFAASSMHSCLRVLPMHISCLRVFPMHIAIANLQLTPTSTSAPLNGLCQNFFVDKMQKNIRHKWEESAREKIFNL